MERDLNGFSTAMDIRDIVQEFVRKELQKLTLIPRWGTVFDINYDQNKASVLLLGDTDPTPVNFSPNCAPTTGLNTTPGYIYSAIPGVTNLEPPGGFSGDLVKVEGEPGNLWITEIVRGSIRIYKPILIDPKIQSSDPTVKVRRFNYSYTVTPGPALGDAVFVSRYNYKDTAKLPPLQFDITIALDDNPNTAVVITKRYQVALRPNSDGYTGSPVPPGWAKLVAVTDSGKWLGEDFELEIECGPTSVAFRIRRTGLNTSSFVMNAYNVDLSIVGLEVEEDLTNQGNLTAVLATPIHAYGVSSPTLSSSDAVGPYLSPELWHPHLMQILLSGGGLLLWDGAIFKWNEKFTCIGASRHELAPEGYFEIPVPTAGDVVAVHSKSGVSSVAAVAGGIPIGVWEALYYELPIGKGFAGLTGRFHVVSYTANQIFKVPSHWILIASRNSEGVSNVLRVQNGTTIDTFRPLTLGLNWTPWGTGFNGSAGGALACRYWRDNNHVCVDGMAKWIGASPTVFNQNVATLPAGYRPSYQAMFPVCRSDFNNNSRVDVLPTGAIILPGTPGIPTGGFVTLNFRFRSEG